MSEVEDLVNEYNAKILNHLHENYATKEDINRLINSLEITNKRITKLGKIWNSEFNYLKKLAQTKSTRVICIGHKKTEQPKTSTGQSKQQSEERKQTSSTP